MAVIRVPKTPKRAFDPGRPASDLLMAKIEHFLWATQDPPDRKTLASAEPQAKLPRVSEGEAATLIATLSARLYTQATEKAEATHAGLQPPPLPPAPVFEAVAIAARATPSTRRRKSAKRTKTARATKAAKASAARNTKTARRTKAAKNAKTAKPVTTAKALSRKKARPAKKAATKRTVKKTRKAAKPRLSAAHRASTAAARARGKRKTATRRRSR